MVGVNGNPGVGSRIFMPSDHGGGSSDEKLSFDDMVFGFYKGEQSFDSVHHGSTSANEEQNEEDAVDHVNKNKAFWEAQQQLLQTTLFRTSSIESKIRQATKEALRESKSEGVMCSCRIPVIGGVGGCRNCLLKNVCGRLQKAGFDSGLCKSKWRSSVDIPSGGHTYIDVVHKTSAKQTEVRVVIELRFRAEFEMARASEEYNSLIERLPEFYVGKAERLRNLVKLLCSAAKKCINQNNMYMAPWRKHKYMQAKWFSPCERTMSGSEPPQTKSLLSLPQLVKPKASLLTFDLLMPSGLQHFAAVQVV